jgi:hypothetical protein
VRSQCGFLLLEHPADQSLVDRDHGPTIPGDQQRPSAAAEQHKRYQLRADQYASHRHGGSGSSVFSPIPFLKTLTNAGDTV